MFMFEDIYIIYENRPMQYTMIFHGLKNDNFQMKNCDIFLIFAQNIDCGNKLEPPLTSIHNLYFGAKVRNQRTSGPVNAHLIFWPSKAQNIQNLENIW